MNVSSFASNDTHAVAQGVEPSPRELRLLRRAALSANAEEVDRARRKFPENKVVLKYCGILHYRREELGTATEVLAKVVAADPSDSEAALFLMRAHYKAGNDEACISIAQTLLEPAPDHTDALRTLGRIYNRRRSWDEAASAWQRLALAVPDDPEASLQAARCYERLQRHAEALLLADRALAANPGSGEAAHIKIDAALAAGIGNNGPLVDGITAYYRVQPAQALGIVRQLARSDRIEICAEAIVALLSAYPNDEELGRLTTVLTESWAFEAERAQVRGDDRRATSYAAGLRIIDRANTAAAASEPTAGIRRHSSDDEGSAQIEAGAFSADKNSYEAARGRENATVRLPGFPAWPAAWVLPTKRALLHQGQRLAAEGDTEAVRHMLPRLIARAGRDVNYLRSVGRLAVAAAAWSAATAAWSRLVACLPDDEEALLHLSRSYTATGEREKAAEAAAALLIRDSDHVEAMQIRTKALLAVGRIDDATTAAAKLVASSPDHARSWFASQPEIWTPLVGSAAFSHATSLGKPEVVQAAALSGIDYLGEGFACEIDGDLVRAFIAFHAAATVRPTDPDAVMGAARVKDECRLQLEAGKASATKLAPLAAVTLLTLCSA